MKKGLIVIQIIGLLYFTGKKISYDEIKQYVKFFAGLFPNVFIMRNFSVWFCIKCLIFQYNEILFEGVVEAPFLKPLLQTQF